MYITYVKKTTMEKNCIFEWRLFLCLSLHSLKERNNKGQWFTTKVLPKEICSGFTQTSVSWWVVLITMQCVCVCVWEFIFCQMPVKAVWICQGSILCGERYKNILYLPLSSPSLLQTFITLPLSVVAIATDHSNCDASTDSLPVSVTLLGHITAATVHQWLFSPVVKDQRDWSWAPGHVLRKESEWNQYLSEYITVVNRRGHIVHGQLPSQGQTTIHAHAFSICSVISVAETHTSTEEKNKN